MRRQAKRGDEGVEDMFVMSLIARSCAAAGLSLVAILAAAPSVAAQQPPRSMASRQAVRSAALPPATRKDLIASLTRAAAYLRQQQVDGRWERHPGITALVATALLRQPGVPDDRKLEDTKAALDWLVRLQQPDGGIYDRDLPEYVTALSMTALVAARRSTDERVIERAQQFLVALQLDEGDGVDPKDPFYGGMGYGGGSTRNDGRADVISLETALRALSESGLAEDAAAWKKAIVFLQRSQNNSELNDQRWAGNDGGFIYYPGFSFSQAGELHSYGSATCAGLLGYVHAGLRRGDPQVQAALKWIGDNYTVDENPGLGQRDVHYYYMVLAKALRAFENPIITDASGRKHNWAVDLGTKLLDLQQPDGYWVNTVGDDLQGNKVVVTALTMLAIEAILE